MSRFFVRLTLGIITLFHLAATVRAGTLDDYYLDQFGETRNTQLQKAVLSVSPAALESARCGMPLKHGLRRDWNLLEQSTQKVLAKQLALPVLSGPAQTLLSLSGKFKIHYTTAGSDAVLSSVWVQTVAQTFNAVAASYTSLQWQLAPTAGNVPYDVYLRNLAPEGFYGVTNSGQPVSAANHPYAFTSWMELDNNYTDSIYKPATYSPLQSLQVTAAHEYHHAIQYGYNYYFDIWYAEATSTWMEDELYDSVNQLYSYIPNWFTQSTLSLDIDESTSTGGGYGRWIFNRYLVEKHITRPDLVLNVWERLAVLNPDTNPVNRWGDIKMTPVLDYVLSNTYNSNLATDFFGFARRVYTRDWTTHSTDTAKIHPYSPVATYSSYPVNSSSSQTPSVTLPHYSFAYYTFKPNTSVPSLTITVAKSAGIQTAVFRKSSGIIKPIDANLGGGSYTDNAFSSSEEVVLLIANTTSSDDQAANFSTDGITPPVTPPVAPVSSGGSDGCFIATAAYGSYLHPQVQMLRNFRDEWLLTNAPGRAFVAFYYRNSPPLADYIARHPIVRGITRLALTPLVIAVVHPLLAAFSLALLVWAVFIFLRRRSTTVRLGRLTHY
jgi:hypothetical protein